MTQVLLFSLKDPLFLYLVCHRRPLYFGGRVRTSPSLPCECPPPAPLHTCSAGSGVSPGGDWHGTSTRLKQNKQTNKQNNNKQINKTKTENRANNNNKLSVWQQIQENDVRIMTSSWPSNNLTIDNYFPKGKEMSLKRWSRQEEMLLFVIIWRKLSLLVSTLMMFIISFQWPFYDLSNYRIAWWDTKYGD